MTILPEVVLPHPVYGFETNSLSKLRSIDRMNNELQNFHCQSLPWPQFVYKMYDVAEASEKIKNFLLTMKIDTGPMDLISLSFWFSKNAILSRLCRQKLFLTNNVFERIILICQSLKEKKMITCKNCDAVIANFDSLFPMSKDGIRTNFCNASNISFLLTSFISDLMIGKHSKTYFVLFQMDTYTTHTRYWIHVPKRYCMKGG